MKVDVVKSRKQPLPAISFATYADAVDMALSVAKKLEAHRARLPWIRERGRTYALSSYDGVRIGGYYGKKTSLLSLEGCTRLISKGKQILDRHNIETRATLSSYPAEVAEAILSGGGDGDITDTLRSIVDQKEAELLEIFRGIKTPRGSAVYLSCCSDELNQSVYIKFKGSGPTELDRTLNTVEEQLLFLKEFKALKKLATEVRAAFQRRRQNNGQRRTERYL